MYLLLQMTITKRYKINTRIIYTKMTNNDSKKTLSQVFSSKFERFLNATKNFLNDGTKRVLQ